MSEPCGTYAAYQAHRKADEDPCTACKAAHADYMRTYRKTHPEKWATELASLRARKRALERLAEEYPRRFLELVAEERVPVYAPHN